MYEANAERATTENNPTAETTVHFLEESEWTEARARHETRVEEMAGHHVRRRSEGRPDPVTDFLFEYYAFRISHLKRFSPGVGTMLLGEAACGFLDRDEFSAFETDRGQAVGLDPRAFPEHLEASTRWILDLLRRTQERPPMFGCSGLHEWAMVYRTEKPRHDWLPMRLSADEIAAVVEEGPLACTHFDAFRFFTDEARPLNRLQPERADMPALEQSGCLHVNMDIYRWAAKRAPWIASELVADAFEFALEIRRVDMQASPYDVSALGLEPIPIETDVGRRRYQEAQRSFHERGLVLRARLIEAYQVLLDAVAERPHSIAIRRVLS
ncbi:MAG: 3-methyladenine DNA glycosylase [Rhodothermales bacterium]|nr:3-methyladenine DNA glycosylase [Rhodothermales bacterium]